MEVDSTSVGVESTMQEEILFKHSKHTSISP